MVTSLLTTWATWFGGVTQLFCPWPHSLQYHARDCRDFHIHSFPSVKFQSHLDRGSAANMPFALVPDLGGIWYLHGNDHASTKLSSFANIQQIVEHDAYTFTTYEGRGAAFSDVGGLHSFLRHAGVTYRVTATNNTAYRITPELHLPPLLMGLTLVVPGFVATFDLLKTSDPDVLVRASTVLTREATPYNMLRIVDAEGQLTPKYYSHYIKNIPPTLVVAQQL
ncbi:hypothetical protein DYB35_012384 [Aphanomyces astaci]|uniref:Uncharacterized protein n=1 Tax=Aphanomyces astaci TaxID=112090 RepID=A0A418DWK5_APHAT|nr:hypothetical protein DYB35_012384 [Aphanomyces astaci]